MKSVFRMLLLGSAPMVIINVIDRRFGWSKVPAVAPLAGAVLVAVGIGALTLVLAQNITS